MKPKHRNIAAGILAYECWRTPYQKAWRQFEAGLPVTVDTGTPLGRALAATTLMGVIDGYAAHRALNSNDPVGTYTDTVKYLRYLTEA